MDSFFFFTYFDSIRQVIWSIQVDFIFISNAKKIQKYKIVNFCSSFNLYELMLCHPVFNSPNIVLNKVIRSIERNVCVRLSTYHKQVCEKCVQNWFTMADDDDDVLCIVLFNMQISFNIRHLYTRLHLSSIAQRVFIYILTINYILDQSIKK